MTISTCKECPNYSADVVSGHSIGTCSEYSKVIFFGGVSPMNHLTNLAAVCPSAGIESSGASLAFSLVEPNLNGSMPSEDLSTCRGCVNFVTVNDSSIPSGVKLCGATGAMIDPESDHVGCPFAQEGIPSGAAKPINPIVTTSVALSANPKAAKAVVTKARVRATTAVATSDPESYPTDREVDEEDIGKIRAWRAVEVGDGAKRQTAYLPIFERDYFDEEARSLIPATGDDHHPELYHDGSGLLEAFVIDGWLGDEPVCLVGEPGTGKTEFARYLSWLMQAPFTHLQLTEDSMPDEVLGKTEFHPERGTFYGWGTLPRGISRPGVVMSDEINTAQDAILQQYRSLNSSAGAIYLESEPDPLKRVVRKHQYCVHLLAVNPVWDARNLGVRELADADVNRLSFVWVEEPSDDVIAQIIVSKLEADGLAVTDDDLVNMLKVRKDIKALARDGALPFSWSIRQDVKVAKKLAYYSPTKAYKRALLDYCHPDAAEAVVKAVQSVFGY